MSFAKHELINIIDLCKKRYEVISSLKRLGNVNIRDIRIDALNYNDAIAALNVSISDAELIRSKLVNKLSKTKDGCCDCKRNCSCKTIADTAELIPMT